LKSTTGASILSEIFSNLGQLVWSKNIATGEVSLLTEGFEELFEYPIAVLKENPRLLVESIHPEDAPYIDLYSKVLLSNTFEQSEYRIITPNGKVKWIQERKKLVKDNLGLIERLDALLIEITEQKEEGLRLFESESTFKALFYKHPSPMWVYDVETLYFLAVNDAAIKFYGYSHYEFFQMTVRQIRQQEDIEELLMAIRSNDFEKYSEKTWKHFKKDGSPIFVKLQSNALKFNGHNARVVHAMDITKQVEAETKTENAYKYLENFQDAVSRISLLGLMDEKGHLVFVNESLLEKTGNESIDLIGKKWTALLSNIYTQEDFNEIWEIIQTKKIWNAQQKFLKKSGQYFWANCTIISIVEGEQAPSQYLLIADDISSLKDAEKRNREYAVKLHNILEGVTDAIFVIDKNWLVTNTNNEAKRLLEKTGESLYGKNIWEIFPAEEGSKFYQFFRKAKKRKITVQFEEFYSPNNQWFDISIYPSKDGLAVCFRNVTERKQKEEERKEILEHLIVQNRDLEEFTYITSHSLRAQIANIIMLSSALDPNGLTPLNHEIFEKLHQSSVNLNMVISDLNTILTVKNKGPVLLEDVNLNNVFVNAMAKIPADLSAFKKYVTPSFEKAIKIRSVRSYLETILNQLITNSIKFRSLDKTPKIEIRSEVLKNKCLISIIDNGIGIDLNKNEKHLFKLYQTFHPGKGGKGMGLYLCKILVDELNGSIDISSEKDKGTKISIIFPIPEA